MMNTSPNSPTATANAAKFPQVKLGILKGDFEKGEPENCVAAVVLTVSFPHNEQD